MQYDGPIRQGVNRHTGGLERHAGKPSLPIAVNRHTGGLEKLTNSAIQQFCVNRHTGGLETPCLRLDIGEHMLTATQAA